MPWVKAKKSYHILRPQAIEAASAIAGKETNPQATLWKQIATGKMATFGTYLSSIYDKGIFCVKWQLCLEKYLNAEI